MGVRADIGTWVADKLAGLVGNRVHLGFADRDDIYPYIVFSMPSTEPEGPMDSGRSVYNRTFEFHCVGDDPIILEDVSDELIQVLDGIKAETVIGNTRMFAIKLESESDQPVAPPEGDENPRYVTTQTYLVQHYKEPPV